MQLTLHHALYIPNAYRILLIEVDPFLRKPPPNLQCKILMGKHDQREGHPHPWVFSLFFSIILSGALSYNLKLQIPFSQSLNLLLEALPLYSLIAAEKKTRNTKQIQTKINSHCLSESESQELAELRASQKLLLHFQGDCVRVKTVVMNLSPKAQKQCPLTLPCFGLHKDYCFIMTVV